MTESLADIEAMSLRCRSDQSKLYISEALQCYRAGAYRAAIVTCWIAVVFDLIDKIRELALAGDGTAKALEEKHEKYIEQIEAGNPQGIQSALEFERDILETCRKDLEFFDPQQYVDLGRLKEDRHRCAHPSFQKIGVPYSPSAEQARLHIRNAIFDVLSQEPIQGKAALAELKTMISSAYFPLETDKALKQLRSSSLNSANEALVKGFIDQLVFGFFKREDPLFYKTQVMVSLNAAHEMYPAIAEERLRKQLNKVMRDVPDDFFPGAAYLATAVSQGWEVLEEAGRDKLRQFIQNGPTDQVLEGLNTFSTVRDLAPVIEARVGALEFDDLATAIEAHGVKTPAKERALHFLSESYSWDRANSVFSKLILPLFDILNRDDIVRIVRMPTEHNSDLPGAHGYELFLKKVRESGLIDDDELNTLLRENGARYLLPQDERA